MLFSTAFPPQLLPGANFLPGIKNSSSSEPSGSRLRTTGLAHAHTASGMADKGEGRSINKRGLLADTTSTALFCTFPHLLMIASFGTP